MWPNCIGTKEKRGGPPVKFSVRIFPLLPRQAGRTNSRPLLTSKLNTFTETSACVSVYIHTHTHSASLYVRMHAHSSNSISELKFWKISLITVSTSQTEAPRPQRGAVQAELTSTRQRGEVKGGDSAPSMTICWLKYFYRDPRSSCSASP